MRPLAWMAIFGTLVLGVGLTLGIVTVRIVEGHAAPSDAPASHGHGRSYRAFGPAGPYLESVGRFAEELELTEEQRAELTRLLEETTERMREHERAMAAVIHATRARVAELLDENQRRRLDELIEQKWAAYKEEKLEQAMRWFREGEGLTPAVLDGVEAALRAYEEAKGDYFRALRHQETWPEREEMKRRLEELANDRDEKLREMLGDEEFGRFQRFARQFSGPPGSRD